MSDEREEEAMSEEMSEEFEPVEGLTSDQVYELAYAAEPLWDALERLGWTDSAGSAEFGRMFPRVLTFIRHERQAS
jgi:hypothetical protein